MDFHSYYVARHELKMERNSHDWRGAEATADFTCISGAWQLHARHSHTLNPPVSGPHAWGSALTRRSPHLAPSVGCPHGRRATGPVRPPTTRQQLRQPRGLTHSRAEEGASHRVCDGPGSRVGGRLYGRPAGPELDPQRAVHNTDSVPRPVRRKTSNRSMALGMQPVAGDRRKAEPAPLPLKRKAQRK